MGFYWSTFFYPEGVRGGTKVFLADHEVIGREDVERGYVRKEELMASYGDVVKGVSPASCVVEFFFCTLGREPPNKTRELPVR